MHDGIERWLGEVNRNAMGDVTQALVAAPLQPGHSGPRYVIVLITPQLTH